MGDDGGSLASNSLSSPERSVAARPDGKELVVGDGCGNVRVFDLASRTERLRLAAHDAEVLSVAYGPNACADDTAVRTSASSPDSTGFPFVDTAEAPEQRLVSSGRDGLVHIYDASLNSDGSPGVYRLEDTVDDHDAAVTGAVIAGLGSECKLVTTGADRKVIFRNLAPLSRVKKSQTKASKASKAFASETMPRGVVHGVALDTRGKTCVTAGADGRLRLWSIANGKAPGRTRARTRARARRCEWTRTRTAGSPRCHTPIRRFACTTSRAVYSWGGASGTGRR